MFAVADANDPDRKMVVSRAPVCVTCRYVRSKTVPGEAHSYPVRKGPFGLRTEWEESRSPDRRGHFCAIAGHFVDGSINRPRLLPECEDERRNEFGCGPSGRNYLYNPKWIAALKAQGIPVHPDLEALFDAPDVVEASNA